MEPLSNPNEISANNEAEDVTHHSFTTSVSQGYQETASAFQRNLCVPQTTPSLSKSQGTLNRKRKCDSTNLFALIIDHSASSHQSMSARKKARK
jgi:hypothetical protein